MEDEHPSLPSNYVSLAVLQERWVKEQQRKQSEKEELQRKHEEDPQKHRPNQNGDKVLHNPLSSSRRPFRRNSQSRRMRDGQTVEVSKPNLKESKIEAFVSKGEANKDEVHERVKVACRKPGVDENLVVLTSRSPPVEKLQVLTTERNDKNGETKSISRQDSVDQAVNHKVPKPRVKMNTVGKTNIGRLQYSRYSQRGDLHWKQTNCKQVWVKKGETTGTQSSGISVNAEMDKQQQQQPRY